MNRWVTTASWLLFSAMMYLILAEMVSPWFSLPDLDNIGFTLVFVLFALAHCAALEGPRFTMQFFLISAVVSYGCEEAGVRTGLIYGSYHYSDMLGAKLGDVPAIIPLAWFMMIYPSWMVGRAILRGINTRSFSGRAALAIVAALAITGWDMVMDPGMAMAHNWVWEQGGAYFGVPLRNYFGWVLTTFVIYWLAGAFWDNQKREKPATKRFAVLPVTLYAFYALRYVMVSRIPALKAVAMFSMGMPGVLALMQLWMKREPCLSEPPSLSQSAP
jgi:uncharacterized membrane protein